MWWLIKRVLFFVGSAIATTIVLAMLAVITSAYVEISFNERAAFGNPRSWFNFVVDATKPVVFRGYYGDNINGRTALRDAKFSLRIFERSRKVVGTKERPDGVSFAIDGFSREDRIVMTHRGLAHAGQAVYVLKVFEDKPEISPNIYAGYVLPEDGKQGGDNTGWVIKCPFVMLEESVAERRYRERSDLLKDFPYLETKCVEFQMPTTLDKTVEDGKSIDEILGSSKQSSAQ